MRRSVKHSIETRGLRKEFRYLNPSPNMSTSDQWMDYILSFITGTRGSGLGVEKRTVVAVDSLDLQVEEGEFFGLLGPNGAGKTTSIKMLSTILAPTEGTATVNGYDLVRQQNAVRASVNTVQSGAWLGFDHNVSIRWNLSLWGRIYGMTRAEAVRRTDEVLELVGLLDKAEESSGVLSSGQRQRLALAKGFLLRAPVLLCDEPTVALDPNSAHSIRVFLKDVVNRKEGQTVLLTTHYMREADQLCDRVAIMDKGCAIACGTPSGLKASAPVQSLILFVEGFEVGRLSGFRSRCPGWHVTEQLDQNGDGSMRVTFSARERQADVVNAVLSSGAWVLRHSPDEVTLEDVFIALTGKGLAPKDPGKAQGPV